MKNKVLFDQETGEINEAPEEQKSPIFRNPWNYKLGDFDKDVEKGGGKSMTVPNEAYTVREILEKFTRGLPLDISKDGTYDEGNEDFESVNNKIDVTEVEEELSFLNEKIAAAKQSKVKGVVKGAEVKHPDITEELKATDHNEA